MFERISIKPRRFQTRLLLALALVSGLIGLAFWLFPARDTANDITLLAATLPAASKAPDNASPKLEGNQARVYLEQTSEGQSLMKALEAERFGLKWQEKSPFASDTGGGYLGMSHEENLNAWFDKEGVTVRPTLPEKERAKAWQMRMRLKAYGYGARLKTAPPVVSRNVKDNRIDYTRNASANSQSGTRNPKLVEWYVNKSEGIEQGFTIDAPPARAQGVGAGEPLRLVVSVTGDLRARVAADGQTVELNRGGEGVLNYSKLLALDANGQKLAARMETNREGDEIALIVDDAAAKYPIVVDPITAAQRQELRAAFPQTDARFGFAVAIDFNLAVVGAWREDVSGLLDVGAVYVFTRLGNTWSLEKVFTGDLTGWSCGWAVSVSGIRILYGCPGAKNSKGIAYIVQRNNPGSYFPQTLEPNEIQVGDRYGESVVVNGNNVVVGAPFHDDSSRFDAGAIFYYPLTPGFGLTGYVQVFGEGANHRFGTSVDVNDRSSPDVIIIAGSPGADSEKGKAHTISIELGSIVIIRPSSLVGFDSTAGDQFGDSVALSGNTVVVGAPLDDNERGINAGAAYVFSGAPNFREQKLMASDGRPGDLFSTHAVAIEGNTIVIGAFGNGQGGDPFNGIEDDNRGAVYIFTLNGLSWRQEAKISQNTFQGGEPGDSFGIDVDINRQDVIIGARAASTESTLRTGAAFIYELNCLPPIGVRALVGISGGVASSNSLTACAGNNIFLRPTFEGGTSLSRSYQWRKNGVNIPGATSELYEITNVGASDAGSYDVVFSNACGSEISTPATVSVRTFSLNPTSPQNFSASGNNSIVNVTVSGSCGWTATSNASWITITSGASGAGNGTVNFTVAPNPGTQRAGTLTIAGQTFNVTQDGAAATPTPTPTPNTVQLSSANYFVGEGGGSAQITATRTGTSAAAEVNYATSDNAGLNECNLFNGVASSRCDYAISIGTLRFAAGESSKTIFIPIVDDSYAEGNETFVITLNNPVGVALGSTPSAIVTIQENDNTTGVNPIDGVDFFIRQNYIDFLGREPDPAGLAGWRNVLVNCGTTIAPPCDRIEVSAGFFRSEEFQSRGYFIYRFYSAMGRIPLYGEFITDFAKVSGFLTADQLEANKVAFVNEFMARAEFQTKYSSTFNNPTAYVDALLVTVGLTSHPGRAGWIATLNSNNNSQTRALVLRAFVESGEVFNKYFNEAFVIMQYFGYLRRTADASYLNWIQTMNQTNGDYRIMINGFMNSIEYRRRFGP